MKIVKARDLVGWNMSVSMLFGKTPKFDIRCGQCDKWFSRRFDTNELPDPITKCPYCRTCNVVPLKF